MMRWLGIVFIFFAGLSVWILSRNQHPPKSKLSESATMDGFMTQALYTQYDNQGQVHLTMQTPKMTHYVKDSTSYFEKPAILAYSQKRIPWTIHADKGVAIHDSEQVDLYGHVIIHQDPQPGNPETTITTNAMTIFPHRSYAETHETVLIVRPNARFDALGMQADFKTGLFTLLTSVKGSYEPPQKKP